MFSICKFNPSFLYAHIVKILSPKFSDILISLITNGAKITNHSNYRKEDSW